MSKVLIQFLNLGLEYDQDLDEMVFLSIYDNHSLPTVKYEAGV